MKMIMETPQTQIMADDFIQIASQESGLNTARPTGTHHNMARVTVVQLETMSTGSKQMQSVSTMYLYSVILQSSHTKI